MSEQIDKAIAIATQAHEGQSSKTGGPFIDHVRRVAENVAGENEKQVAWLHDVVEKGPGWTFERLREEGFSQAVVDAVDAMSKRDGEEYFAFVRRSIENPLARPVKRADLTDNLAQMRQMGGDGSKFAEGLRILNEQYPARPTEP
ncbi:(p)ppGpp synthase/HD superfamily hydrolase [Neorhizobium galegae]|uniref:HD domain-containing protein n=1 Tax=Neorhizobium galegae TaxID=399 RepID=UPI001AEA7F3C|nr:HD domain-containing protein [Neorhizobium galegae]MBP2561815.1 (p)ppGpp synthase/HD superfamily hydrolase [Neorhizobium galegae]MDQ0134818.1 (p)ppGpp synthase/HD superfamily hydrolase [Neorhizobium galegae]